MRDDKRLEIKVAVEIHAAQRYNYRDNRISNISYFEHRSSIQSVSMMNNLNNDRAPQLSHLSSPSENMVRFLTGMSTTERTRRHEKAIRFPVKVNP
mmetsp:Transcript_11735/g.17772  ORF Transcript_11735/g.17772 Transcript_11735/m.17772 type:complete len:96 (-) Transcript_11735:240-527(-)